MAESKKFDTSQAAAKAIQTGRDIITNKQSRSALFLVITIIVILILNSLMPMFEGGSHYTEIPESVTYIEYVQRKEEDKNIQLTYKSQLDIEIYKDKVRKQLEAEGEIDAAYIEIDIPDNFPVKIYTKFFYQNMTWYVSTGIHTVSVVLMFYSIFNYILAKHKNTYKKYLDLNDEVESLSNAHIDPNTFEPYMVDVFNKARKINQHKANVKYALERLESKTSYKTRVEYKKHPDSNNWRVKRYVKKRNKLLNKLTDEYIEEFVVEGRVKHFKYIHPTFVTCGANIAGRTVDTYSLLQSDNEKLTKQGVPRVMRTLAFTVSLALLLTLTVQASLDKPLIWIVINALVKLVPLLLQIVFAYDYRDNFMNNQLIPNLLNRKSIIILYLAYVKNNREEAVTNAKENQQSS